MGITGGVRGHTGHTLWVPWTQVRDHWSVLSHWYTVAALILIMCIVDYPFLHLVVLALHSLSLSASLLVHSMLKVHIALSMVQFGQ